MEPQFSFACRVVRYLFGFNSPGHSIAHTAVYLKFRYPTVLVGWICHYPNMVYFYIANNCITKFTHVGHSLQMITIFIFSTANRAFLTLDPHTCAHEHLRRKQQLLYHFQSSVMMDQMAEALMRPRGRSRPLLCVYQFIPSLVGFLSFQEQPHVNLFKQHIKYAPISEQNICEFLILSFGRLRLHF